MKRCNACNANLLLHNTMYVVIDKGYCNEMCARSVIESDVVYLYGEEVSTSGLVTKMTVEQFISELTDKELTVVFKELDQGIVPKYGAAHDLCKIINRNIDKGILYINQYTYRRMYLPSLVKYVHRELAKRYTEVCEK